MSAGGGRAPAVPTGSAPAVAVAVADAGVEATDRTAAALLELLGRDGACALPRLCKRLGLSRSELQRLLLVLSAPCDGDGDGLGLVVQRDQDGRVVVALSQRGADLLGAGR